MEGSNERDGIFTRTKLRGMLKGKAYEAVEKIFSFSADFINKCTGNEETAPVTRLHTRYSKTIVDVPEYMGSRCRAKSAR